MEAVPPPHPRPSATAGGKESGADESSSAIVVGEKNAALDNGSGSSSLSPEGKGADKGQTGTDEEGLAVGETGGWRAQVRPVVCLVWLSGSAGFRTEFGCVGCGPFLIPPLLLPETEQKRIESGNRTR